MMRLSEFLSWLTGSLEELSARGFFDHVGWWCFLAYTFLFGLVTLRGEPQRRAERWRFLAALAFLVVVLGAWEASEDAVATWLPLSVAFAWIGIEGWSLAADRDTGPGSYLAVLGMVQGALLALGSTFRNVWEVSLELGVAEGVIAVALGLLLTRVLQLGARAVARGAWSDATLAALAPLGVGSWAQMWVAPATPPELLAAVWLVYALSLGTALVATGVRDRALLRVDGGLLYLAAITFAHVMKQWDALGFPTAVALGVGAFLAHRWARRRIARAETSADGSRLSSSTDGRQMRELFDELMERAEATDPKAAEYLRAHRSTLEQQALSSLSPGQGKE